MCSALTQRRLSPYLVSLRYRPFRLSTLCQRLWLGQNVHAKDGSTVKRHVIANSTHEDTTVGRMDEWKIEKVWMNAPLAAWVRRWLFTQVVMTHAAQRADRNATPTGDMLHSAERASLNSRIKSSSPTTIHYVDDVAPTN